MNKLFLLSILVLLASCGKDGSSSSSVKGPGPMNQEYEEVLTDSIPDLLNVTLDVPVEVTTDRIQFLRDASVADSGAHITCRLQTGTGDIWHHTLRGPNLSVDLGTGQPLTFKKESSLGAHPYGVWHWQGVENGMKVLRQLTLLEGRLILSQDCQG